MEQPIISENEPKTDEIVEIIRDEVRKNVETTRKQHRNEEVNNHRRAALGMKFSDDINQKCDWTVEDVLEKGNLLKKKALKPDDYKKLQAALLQSEENINTLMSIDGILPALVRDLSSTNPEIQLLALNCCCNIALGSENTSVALIKHIGPYLVTKLESHNKPILEVTAWTIGNLCKRGSQEVHKYLGASNCFNHLVFLLDTCPITILPSILYALRFYLFKRKPSTTNSSSDSELVKVSKVAVKRFLRDNFRTYDILWFLGLLSSENVCRAILMSAAVPIIKHLYTILANEEKPGELIMKEVSAIIRILGNLSSEASGTVAQWIFDIQEAYPSISIEKFWKTLLWYPYPHVGKETVWLIGNLYNHASSHIRQLARKYIKSEDIRPAMASKV